MQSGRVLRVSACCSGVDSVAVPAHTGQLILADVQDT